MAEKKVLVVGAGGHAEVVVATLLAAGLAVDVLLDDDPGKWGETLLGFPVEGPVNTLRRRRPSGAVLAVGDNRTRKSLAERFPGVPWISAVHPSAVVHSSVRLGPGTVVFAGAVIQPCTRIGRHVIVNTGATVDHDCRLDDFVHAAPGVHLAGGVHAGEGAFIGIGSAAVENVSVGPWSVVGAGSVVLRDLPANVVAFGSPARPVRQPPS